MTGVTIRSPIRRGRGHLFTRQLVGVHFAPSVLHTLCRMARVRSHKQQWALLEGWCVKKSNQRGGTFHVGAPLKAARSVQSFLRPMTCAILQTWLRLLMKTKN